MASLLVIPCMALSMAPAERGLGFVTAPPPTASVMIYHVKTTGSDANPGSEDRPFQTVQKAVSIAEAGDTIQVHAGTYEGVVQIRRSGTEDAPIVLTGAGDGRAVLVAGFPTLECSERAPTRDRTIQILGGADGWTIRDLSVVNGILIMAPNAQRLTPSNFTDRTLPGHGTYRPEDAEQILPAFDVDPSDYISLVDLDVHARGLLIVGARHGQLLGTRIHDIDCGTGPAVWLNRFSSFWTLRDNEIINVAASTEHYMSEGIRLGGGSSYNLVERNRVEHLHGPGRGITADVGASWNIFQKNNVRDADVNFSEQAAGWGNRYLYNLSESARRVGYQVYGIGGMDEEQKLQAKLRRKGPAAEEKMKEAEARPEGYAIPRYLLFQCNDSRNDPVAFKAGDVADSKFLDNNWSTIRLSEKLRRNWSTKNNEWDAESSSPSDRPPTSSFASCDPQPSVDSR